MIDSNKKIFKEIVTGINNQIKNTEEVLLIIKQLAVRKEDENEKGL